ncbi:MAG: hypothetical protein C0490_02360 [Marivirga sp.]|nr:hypothetical protein [Marivirga sp.]
MFMKKTQELSLFLTIITWAMLIGGVMYSHIVYFPSYLSHLPESNSLITGDYGLHDENFWMFVHPFVILSTVTALILNWKHLPRRRFIAIPLIIYGLALVATAFYFVPGLLAFAGSGNSTTVTAAEWFQRGQTWQHMSWIRGFSLFTGFVMLLIALQTKGDVERM